MRNRCDDQFSRRGDLLISFSDGLWVVAGGSVPESLVAIGQQFVVPGFDLDPGETRSWFVTVAAEDPLRAAPEHITEHYVGGRVQQRIDGIFLLAEGTARHPQSLPHRQPARQCRCRQSCPTRPPGIRS
jgi:hypothetical protein